MVYWLKNVSRKSNGFRISKLFNELKDSIYLPDLMVFNSLWSARNCC